MLKEVFYLNFRLNMLKEVNVNPGNIKSPIFQGDFMFKIRTINI